jgi:hypothetical protein
VGLVHRVVDDPTAWWCLTKNAPVPIPTTISSTSPPIKSHLPRPGRSGFCFGWSGALDSTPAALGLKEWDRSGSRDRPHAVQNAASDIAATPQFVQYPLVSVVTLTTELTSKRLHRCCRILFAMGTIARVVAELDELPTVTGLLEESDPVTATGLNSEMQQDCPPV